MAIFGLRPRKSTSSTASSFSKHRSDAASPNQNPGASDAIGDTPEFGQLSSNRRSALHASDSAYILSRKSSSMKKFFGSTRRKGSQSIDGGSPAQPNKNSLPSDYFANAASKQASRTSLNNRPAVSPAVAAPATPPVITPSAIAPSLSAPAGPGSPFAEAVGRDVSGGLASSPALPAGPRPSELFAGKGVQWNEIDLTGRDITKPTDAATSTVDMQKFLKERRQWIPTFKDSDAVEEAAVELPKSLDQFSFATPAEIAKSSAGLKSLSDLEDTHKRKAALLNQPPLTSSTNGTIFEEAGPSTSVLSNGSGSAPSAAAGSKSGSQKLPPPPAPPSRNQSFRTSTFATTDNAAPARKSGSINRKPAPTLGVNGGGADPSSSPASRDIPQRRSSVRKELSELDAGTASETTAVAAEPSTTNGDPVLKSDEQPRAANGRVDQIKEQVARPATATSTGSVRPSIETAGFATPAGSQSQDGEHAAPAPSTQSELPKTPTTATQEATQDSASTVAAPTSPPRPPKNGQRTPSRQNSKEPINGGLSKSPSTAFTPAEPAHSEGNDLIERVAQAAPALQNTLPGTGAATSPHA